MDRKNFFAAGSIGSFGGGFLGFNCLCTSSCTQAVNSFGVILEPDFSGAGFSFFFHAWVFFGLGGGGGGTQAYLFFFAGGGDGGGGLTLGSPEAADDGDGLTLGSWAAASDGGSMLGYP